MAQAAVPAPPKSATPKPKTGRSIGDSRILGPFTSIGKIMVFGGDVLGQTPLMLARYIGEVWWYAAFLAIGSTPVILLLVAFTGLQCSVEAYYSLSQIGAQGLVGVFNALCDMREITPLFFGFALGAKIGCGLVAELGTMRVNEEIDALDVMGMPTVRYVVTSRVIAALLIMPFMYFLALASSFTASWAVQHFQVGQISDGAYFDYFWRFLNIKDLVFSMIKAISFAFLIILVAIYYGFHVTGGAVGIGKAVAKTMAVSLVMTVLVNAFMTQLFWGVDANLPIPGG
ncbi:MAG: phospholipid/cholesterol/gamma-HCH transport system permease protein [Chloroflexota bacterium]|jgi:phospholipid/cholesterol/gamma-HCH transport system permease protein|nr:phospholipid/cholesterol/gamma-HCH transport system permease protein [Chloroflexota bacterium]